MAKSKKTKKLGLLSRFSKQQLIITSVFVLGFGGLGVWKLAFSSAARPSKGTSVVFTRNVAGTADSPLVTVVDTSMRIGGGYGGAIQALKVPPGGKIMYGGAGASVPQPITTTQTQSCYTITAIESNTTVRIRSGTNSRDVIIKYVNPNDSGSFWQYECVPYSTGGTYSDYSLEHISGGTVYVYKQDNFFTANY